MDCPVCGMSTGVFMTGVVVLHESCYEGIMMLVEANSSKQWKELFAAAESAEADDESKSQNTKDES